MIKFSNSLIGLINFLTFLLSIAILGGGIWLSTKANNSDCLKFLQWPLIIIGVALMVVSLAGFVGACYRNTFLLWFYLLTMFFIIAAFLVFIVFAYVVTDKGSGRHVMNRNYLDYYLSDYSGWLKERVQKDSYWSKISSCIRDSHVCSKMGVEINGVPESADMFYLRKLSPIQSGCCKPPTVCGYVYENETMWNQGGGTMDYDLDCSTWSNDQSQLCYACNSCRAGVLATVKKHWRKISIVNIVLLVLLVIVYIIGIAAFRNNKRIENDEPYSSTRMTKSQPSRIHF
ncbi:hypothetical protein NE237_003315 [Protea cynaroides]|uniref:Tetraspanin-3 n=1 Tax=Protea cynaroides TaxID=273540 RepID=A0A9Q0KH52_9MAGN|nr:hypothetical protein NE237_003315 [Protea cynaroides]